MIEKKVWRNVLHGTWTDGLREECEKENVFENSFTEVKNSEFTTENNNASTNRKTTFRNSQSLDGKQLSSNGDEVPSARVKCPPSVSQDTGDDDKIPVDDSFDKNIDEVDYFDNDEFMESRCRSFEEKDLDLFLEDIIEPVSGRYGKFI
jgi:hypothetical protein